MYIFEKLNCFVFSNFCKSSIDYKSHHTVHFSLHKIIILKFICGTPCKLLLWPLSNISPYVNIKFWLSFPGDTYLDCFQHFMSTLKYLHSLSTCHPEQPCRVSLGITLRHECIIHALFHRFLPRIAVPFLSHQQYLQFLSPYPSLPHDVNLHFNFWKFGMCGFIWNKVF